MFLMLDGYWQKLCWITKEWRRALSFCRVSPFRFVLFDHSCLLAISWRIAMCLAKVIPSSLPSFLFWYHFRHANQYTSAISAISNEPLQGGIPSTSITITSIPSPISIPFFDSFPYKGGVKGWTWEDEGKGEREGERGPSKRGSLRDGASPSTENP